MNSGNDTGFSSHTCIYGGESSDSFINNIKKMRRNKN